MLRAMGSFRLFRRIRIAPGVTINVSKSGLSTSLGPRGAKVTFGRRGVRKTVGLPGTGLYYTSLSSTKSGSVAPAGPVTPPAASTNSGWSRRTWIGILLAIVILAAVVGSSLGGGTSAPAPSAPPAAIGLLGAGAGALGASTARPPAVASPTTTNAPAATKKPAATSKPTAKPKRKAAPSPTPTSTKLGVKVSSRTASVPRNSTATVSIKTSPKARCSIDVEYKSGPSTAAGLGAKTASSTGAVSWSWKVGSNTTKGTWPIYISCDLGQRSGGINTSFTVR